MKVYPQKTLSNCPRAKRRRQLNVEVLKKWTKGYVRRLSKWTKELSKGRAEEMRCVTKQELTRLKDLNGRLRNVSEVVEQLQSEAERVTTLLSGMPRGTKLHSALEEFVLKTVQMQEEIEQLRIEQVRLQMELIVSMKKLDGQSMKLLRLRYIECKGFATIADALNTSTSNIFRLHRKALKSILTQ